MSKFLIIIRSTMHFSHCSSVIDEISKNHKVKLVFMNDSEINNCTYKVEKFGKIKKLIQKNKNSYETETLISSGKNIEIIDGVHREDKWNKPLKILRETLNNISFIMRNDKSVFYMNQKKYVPNIINFLNRLGFAKKIVNSKLIFSTLKRLHNLIPASSQIKQFIKKINPDLILVIGGNWSSSHNKFSSEIDYIKAANELKIKNAIQIISWDNLTARGLYHYEPDLMLVWNKNQFWYSNIWVDI